MTALNFYYPTTQPAIAPSIVVRKERVLPIPGDVTVRQGARVEPDDIVARALLPGMPRAVEVASVLGIPAAEGLKTFSKEVGASVQAGDVLAARRVGLARRLAVKSPIDGVLSRYDGRTGQAIITPVGTPLDVPAALNGFVAEQVPYRGVIIETPAAVVRGIAGVGGERHGVLQVAVADAAEELLPERVTARLAYSIVLGGGTTSAAALQRAVEHNVRAVIVGSIPESELRAFLAFPDGLQGWRMGRSGWEFPPRRAGASAGPPLTLILVEGFGRAPMATRAWELLAGYDGAEAYVDGTTRLRGEVVRPEIIVPQLQAAGPVPAGITVAPLNIRSRVRLLMAPYLGQTGRVVALPPGKQPLDSGYTAPAAEVELGGGRRLLVPLVNLEVIE